MVSNDIEVGRRTNRSRSSLYDGDDDDEELGLPGQQINADNSVRRHRQRRREDGRTEGRTADIYARLRLQIHLQIQILRYRDTELLRCWDTAARPRYKARYWASRRRLSWENVFPKSPHIRVPIYVHTCVCVQVICSRIRNPITK